MSSVVEEEYLRELRKSFQEPELLSENGRTVVRGEMLGRYLLLGTSWCVLNKVTSDFFDPPWIHVQPHALSEMRNFEFSYSLDGRRVDCILTITKPIWKPMQQAVAVVLRAKCEEGNARTIWERITNLKARQEDVERDKGFRAMTETADRRLSGYGVTLGQVCYDDVALTEPIADALMATYEEHQGQFGELLLRGLQQPKLPKPLRAKIVRWLIKQVPQVVGKYKPMPWGPQDALYFMVLPGLGDELRPIAVDPHYGEERWKLIEAYAKTKHPLAAETLADLLSEPSAQLGAIRGLGYLKAVQYAEKLMPFLNNAALKSEARKALTKMGAPGIPMPPKATHVIRSSGKKPGGLDEWSTNADIDDLEPLLKLLAESIDSGFGPQEIAEVLGVAEKMSVESTKTFKFPVQFAGAEHDVWLEIFMDDTDSPDIAVFASPPIINAFDPKANALMDNRHG